MTDERKNPCGENKEIDEYLDGTICEVEGPDVNDVEAPEDGDYEVDVEEEIPAEEVDRYEGLL